MARVFQFLESWPLKTSNSQPCQLPNWVDFPLAQQTSNKKRWELTKTRLQLWEATTQETLKTPFMLNSVRWCNVFFDQSWLDWFIGNSWLEGCGKYTIFVLPKLAGLVCWNTGMLICLLRVDECWTETLIGLYSRNPENHICFEPSLAVYCFLVVASWTDLPEWNNVLKVWTTETSPFEKHWKHHIFWNIFGGTLFFMNRGWHNWFIGMFILNG